MAITDLSTWPQEIIDAMTKEMLTFRSGCSFHDVLRRPKGACDHDRDLSKLKSVSKAARKFMVSTRLDEAKVFRMAPEQKYTPLGYKPPPTVINCFTVSRAIEIKTTQEGPTMTPANCMKDAAIERELSRLRKKWDGLEREGGGSPGEWIVERIGELEHEQRQRMRGVLPRADIPLQSA